MPGPSPAGLPVKRRLGFLRDGAASKVGVDMIRLRTRSRHVFFARGGRRCFEPVQYATDPHAGAFHIRQLVCVCVCSVLVATPDFQRNRTGGTAPDCRLCLAKLSWTPENSTIRAVQFMYRYKTSPLAAITQQDFPLSAGIGKVTWVRRAFTALSLQAQLLLRLLQGRTFKDAERLVKSKVCIWTAWKGEQKHDPMGAFRLTDRSLLSLAMHASSHFVAFGRI